MPAEILLPCMVCIRAVSDAAHVICSPSLFHGDWGLSDKRPTFFIVLSALLVVARYIYLDNPYQQNIFWWQEYDLLSSLNIGLKKNNNVRQLYAVYDCNRPLLYLLIGFGILDSIGVGIIVHFCQNQLHPRQTPSGCYPEVIPGLMFAMWLPLVFFETTLLLLMLYKAWTLYQEKEDFPMLRALLRDRFYTFSSGVKCMMIIKELSSTLAAILVSAAVLAPLPHSQWTSLGEMADGWIIVIPNAMVSRLLPNMRREYYDRLSPTSFPFNQDPNLMGLNSLRVSGLERDLRISSRRMETESSFRSDSETNVI
ncbi:hypothetical protein BU17DRAFT_70482 [Hysterangium stoloniferum]|nr:hypothetical protein BU17DRAFT_70482 [Hysterangium stoloniferum]